MKILKQGKPLPPIPETAIATCIFCKAELEVEGKDIYQTREGFQFDCPCCGHNQGTQLTLKGMRYDIAKMFEERKCDYKIPDHVSENLTQISAGSVLSENRIEYSEGTQISAVTDKVTGNHWKLYQQTKEGRIQLFFITDKLDGEKLKCHLWEEGVMRIREVRELKPIA